MGKDGENTAGVLADGDKLLSPCSCPSDTLCHYTVCLRIGNVKSAHPVGRLRISNIECPPAACRTGSRCAPVLPGQQAGSVIPWMTEMDLPSLQS